MESAVETQTIPECQEFEQGTAAHNVGKAKEADLRNWKSQALSLGNHLRDLLGPP